MRVSLAVLVAAASGWVSLSYEILWYRTFSYVTWGTAAIFSLVLAAFLLGIAMGSRRAKALCKGDDRGAWAARLAWLLLVANAVSMLVVPLLGFSAKVDWRPVLLLVVAGAGLMGAVLPLVAQFGIEPDDRAGWRLALVYAGNIAGSALGSLLTGFVMMDRFSTRTIATVLATVGFVTAILVTWLVRSDPKTSHARLRVAPLAALGIAVSILGGDFLYGQLYERLLYKERWSADRRFKRLIENRHGVIAVAKDDTVWGGGGYDGAFNIELEHFEKNFIHRAYAVEAMRSPDSPAMRDILMIGLGSGSWAQVVANLPSTRSLTVVELNSGYTTLVQENPMTASLVGNPKVTLVVDDGRRWLLRHPDRKFDYIVMNTAITWRAHMTNLLSVEFFGIIRQHLQPWGIHFFNSSDVPFQLCSTDVLRTAIALFPSVLRVMSFIAVSDAPIAFDRDAWKHALFDTRIDGRAILAPDSPAVEKLLAFAESESDPDPMKVDRLERGASMAPRLGPGELVTDDNMLPEIRHIFALPAGAP